jgi:sialate O-acetylesterase
MRIVLSALLCCFIAPVSVQAELSVPHFFSDHMVLQRETAVLIWGTADAGASVTVSFRGQNASSIADAEGRWKVRLPTGAAVSEGSPLKIASMPSGETITIQDVLVGEVWFASGQSNMVFTMNRVPAYAAVTANANFPQIRMFNAPTVTAVEPQEDIDGEWTLCSPDTAPGYSAVAFFFARKLHSELGIPVGVIKSAWGGKPVETFTSREALSALPGTKALVDAVMAADATFDAAQAQAAYERQLKQWESANSAGQKQPVAQGGRRSRRPARPKRPLDSEGQPGVLFNSMIHPFVGYTLRGAIWYQGEANAKAGAVPYSQTLPLLINDWRNRWGDEFSFYYVQLANFREPSTEPGSDDPWPLLQDQMRLVLQTTPKTGMAIINDIGEAKDIHPRNKHDVGERLALWALAKDYGRQELIFSGPLFRASNVREGKVEVRFDHVGAGLKSRDGQPLARFEIAGADGVWHWAEAQITAADTVTVTSNAVAKPVGVRYAWAANPAGANLVNSAGLPASVFSWR